MSMANNNLPPQLLRARIEARSEPVPESGCCLWTASCDSGGYGRLYVKGTVIRATRASWIANRGPIPEGMSVCHKCDTPQCVNPDHLFLGSHKENMEDMVRKGRSAGPAKKPCCKHSHPLTGRNLYLIRRKTGRTVRDCRACRVKAGERRTKKKRTRRIS